MRLERKNKMSENSKISSFFESGVKWGLYILAFLLPLFFLPFTTNVLDLNKLFLLFIFTFVLLVFWLAKILTQRKLEIHKSLVNILAVLFLLAVLVSSLAAKSTFQSLIGFGGSFGESLLALVCLGVIYFLVSNTLKTQEEIDMLLFGLLASSFLVGIFAFLQLDGIFIFGWDFAKAAGFNTVGSVNALEIFLAAILVMAVTLFIDNKRPLWQLVVLGGISVMILFLLIFMNFANVWWGLIGVMILVVGFGIVKQGRSSQTRLILAMVVLAMALLLTLTKINISAGWLNIPAEVSPSYQATLQIDKGTLGDRLFFGTGPGTFGYNWELYRSAAINQTIFWNVRFSQGVSKIFAMPSSLGIIGTAFWLLLVLYFAVWGAKKILTKKGEHWTLAFSFYSGWLFLAVMQFIYPTNITLEFMFWLTLGVSLLLLKSLGDSEDAVAEEKITSLSFSKESPLASVFSFLLVIFLVLAISFFYLGFNYWRADALFQEGVKASVNEGNLEKGYNEILKAAGLDTYYDTYLNSLSQVAILRVNQELAQPKSTDRDLKAQQFIADSVNLSKAATDINPQNPDNWIQRGTVYRAVLGYLSGAEDWMITSFSEASRLQPKNPYTYFELGRSYLLLSDFVASQAGDDKDKQAKVVDYLNKAEEQFNKAIEVKSDYSPAHYQLALIYDRQGKIDSAINKMEMTKANFPNDIGVAFQLGLLYYKKQSWDSARVEFERAVTLDQNYSNARYFLGLIYDKQGNKDAAIEQFKKIADLNPDNTEVKTILANLASGRSALYGIAPPGPAPEKRSEQPVPEKAPQVK